MNTLSIYSAKTFSTKYFDWIVIKFRFNKFIQKLKFTTKLLDEHHILQLIDFIILLKYIFEMFAELATGHR
ncbi:hypothetical protein BpHYR1_048020 [Brachionus plicatilis]|uniref:Uncharacterized protein n=1 Tax=Brachionus plicatilis TaxID=10195 RepID=A0A3M7TA10_BRAPC|nr:hypothetical protein BpHYR1_048020 [Brachionus plicatilis]